MADGEPERWHTARRGECNATALFCRPNAPWRYARGPGGAPVQNSALSLRHARVCSVVVTALRDIDDVIDDHTGRARTVLEYCRTTGELVQAAKRTGFTADSWSPLAELVDTEAFVRVGNFKEVMNWQEYVMFLTSWAASSDWECSFKRITEHDGVVFLELEERSRVGDFSNSVNSLTVYEFTDGGRIVRIDVYLQMALPDPDMLKSYDGVEITG